MSIFSWLGFLVCSCHDLSLTIQQIPLAGGVQTCAQCLPHLLQVQRRPKSLPFEVSVVAGVGWGEEEQVLSIKNQVLGEVLYVPILPELTCREWCYPHFNEEKEAHKSWVACPSLIPGMCRRLDMNPGLSDSSEQSFTSYVLLLPPRGNQPDPEAPQACFVLMPLIWSFWCTCTCAAYLWLPCFFHLES